MPLRFGPGTSPLAGSNLSGAVTSCTMSKHLEWEAKPSSTGATTVKWMQGRFTLQPLFSWSSSLLQAQIRTAVPRQRILLHVVNARQWGDEEEKDAGLWFLGLFHEYRPWEGHTQKNPNKMVGHHSKKFGNTVQQIWSPDTLAPPLAPCATLGLRPSPICTPISVPLFSFANPNYSKIMGGLQIMRFFWFFFYFFLVL